MPSNEAPAPALIGAAEAATRLGVHRVTITRAVHDGTLTPAAKLPGKSGAYLFTRADIDALAATRARGTR